MYNYALGVELALRHIRDGVELRPIDVNRNYDFDFQQTNSIPSVQILPVSIYICIAIATNIKYAQNAIVAISVLF